MADTHSVFGGDQGASGNSSSADSFVDNGIDYDVSTASGTSSPTGIALSFSNSDTSSDIGLWSDSVANTCVDSGGTNNAALNYMTGTFASDAEVSGYGTYNSNTLDDSNWVSGTKYVGGVAYNFSEGNGSSETLVTTVTGPPPSTATLTSVSGSVGSSAIR